MDDEDVPHLQVVEGVLRPHRALHVVAAADAVHVGELAVRDPGVGVGGGDHDQVHPGVDLAGGDGHAGVQVAHHAQDVGVVDDAVGVGHAHVGVGLVVVGDELEVKAQGLEPGLGLLNGQLRPQLDLLPQGRLGARQRRLAGDLDDVGLAQGHAQGGYTCYQKPDFPHSYLLTTRSRCGPIL